MQAAVAAGLPCVSGRCCQPRQFRRVEGQQEQQQGEASSLARFSGISARLVLPRLCARTVRATGRRPLLLRRSAVLSTAVAAALLVQVHAMWPFSDHMRRVWAAANELQKREGKNVYTVQAGDTLYGIAGRLGTTVEILKEANELRSDTIYPGQELWTPRVYEIQQGDTLLGIARRFETTLEAILEINQIDDPNVIRAGDVMLLP